MTARGRGRPRREGADEEILATALELLRAKGYRDLTVDDVAAQAGVAKTTVYRRWPSKGVLVAAALAPLAIASTRDNGSLEDDLVAILRDTVGLLRIIGETQSDPELIDVVRAAIAPRRAQLLGALAAFDDRELLADLLTGALWTRLLVTHAPIDDGVAARIVRAVLHGVKPA
ncbi:MAG TPA: TetR/AcrR family transcriptional regulator [Thermoanaerobaculia bacterium]|jgi:AcrR family transcriptional regulator